MGYVKNRIKELSKEAGSKKKARESAESWYRSGLRNRQVKEAVNTRERFVPGKIYVFNYSPITPDLEWFDRNPVVLAIEQVDDNDLGINLNLLPVRVKEQLLDDLYNRMSGQIKNATTGSKYYDAARQSGLRITYEGMKAYLKNSGCDFAIRQYKPERKSNQAVVSYNNWAEIALCDFISLSGSTIAQIRAMFLMR